MNFRNLNIYIPLVILLGGFLIGLFVKRPTYKTPEGYVLTTQVFLDSLKEVANKPPIITIKDSIVHDTVEVPAHHDPEPKPNPVDSTHNDYFDHLYVAGQIDASVKFTVDGTLISGIDWNYRPIYKLQTITIDRPKPYPVFSPTAPAKYKNGVYASLVVDWDKQNFLGLGADVDFVTKNDYIYGFQYRRFGDQNIYGVKAGFRLKF